MEQKGDPRWYEKARREARSRKAPRRESSTLLPLSLIREVDGDRLEPFHPQRALRSLRAPALAPSKPIHYLRRFNGRRVIPLNITQIFNGDDRAIYADTTYPWVCIGQLRRPDGSNGTATLVGPSLILTASHALLNLWQPGGPLAAGVTFTPACFDGPSLLGADWTANVVNVAAWETINECDGYDMAVCQLDQPMGDWLGYLGASGYDDDWEDEHVWAHAGYPYDISPGGNEPCFQLGISVIDDDSDDYDTLELETEADTASGQSGGPLFATFTDGGIYAVGTLSGIEDNFGEPKNALFAGGNGLVRLVKWGRDNFP